MITLHRRSNGTFITSIRCDADRSWVINNKGKCSLYMSVQDEKVIRKYMGERNLIHIGHSKLDNWGGVVETDQDWDDKGGINFTAWSAESFLIGRTPDIGLVNASSPGALFVKLIAEANRPEDLRIRMGNVYEGGGAAETTLDGTNLLDIIRDLAERWDMEFSIDPVLDTRNNLTFEANWYQRQGRRMSYQLSEGFNVRRHSQTLRVRRRVVNHLFGYGDGNTEDRPKYDEIDAGSRALYGLMQGTEDYDGVTTVTGVKENVQKRLKVLRYPKKIIRLIAEDKGDCFTHLRRGNVLPFKATSFGFQSGSGVGLDSPIRVMGIRYLDKTNECEITNNTEESEE